MLKELTAADIAYTREVLTQIAPDELPVLQELAKRPSWRDRFRSTSLGYGWTADAAIITPYAILVCTWARSVILDEAKEITEKRLRSLTRRFLRGDQKPPAPPSTAAALAQPGDLERQIVKYAVALGMDDSKARVLGRAVTATIRDQGIA